MNVFTYNQEQAKTVGAGEWITKSGGYDLSVVRAQFTASQTQGSQAKFLEMDVVSREGQKCNYISVCYVKGDGAPLQFGEALIQAIMGCAKIGAMTMDQNGNCPELIGKNFKAVLQRTDFTKNNGEDGYKFDLKLPAMMNGQTIKESISGEAPKAFNSYAESVSDKDERKQNTQIHSAQQQNGTPEPKGYGGSQQVAGNDFDDDIPF